jgi:succinate dehydrogenase / fumarate reductase iron-sulfur subunit
LVDRTDAIRLVIKDLIVDMTKFWDNLAKADPASLLASLMQIRQHRVSKPVPKRANRAAANCIPLGGSLLFECNHGS